MIDYFAVRGRIKWFSSSKINTPFAVPVIAMRGHAVDSTVTPMTNDLPVY